jgi:hypothetical protein
LSRGPSGKTWPRWLSPCLERTSVRAMPCELSTFSTTFAASRGRVKLGHPVPLSNLSKDAKSGSRKPRRRRGQAPCCPSIRWRRGARSRRSA